MATHCKRCGRELMDRKNLYCKAHAIQTLRSLDAAGFLEPLTLTTVDGVQKLSSRRFLTLPDEPTPTPN